VYTGSAVDALTELACFGGGNGTGTLAVTAGQVLSFQLGASYFAPGPAGFAATFVAAPGNDDIANATALGIPDTAGLSLTGASMESGEARPSCAWDNVLSVWYRITAPADSFTLSLGQDGQSLGMSAYTGTPGSLTELGCRVWTTAPLTVRGTQGSTVYVSVWAMAFQGGSGPVTLTVDHAPAAQAGISSYPFDPAMGEDIAFYDNTSDPGGNTVTAQQWSFGDGSTTTDINPIHRYAADGDYQVAYTATLSDGRTASTTATISVKTHDVGIAKFMVPTSAKTGQSKTITIGIGNRHYPENVTIQLLIVRQSGGEVIGQQTLDIPVLGANQTRDVSFTYTFTKADAAGGKVVFKAFLLLNSARDFVPGDNEATALATKVTR
jgi:hypothetical protein